MPIMSERRVFHHHSRENDTDNNNNNNNNNNNVTPPLALMHRGRREQAQVVNKLGRKSPMKQDIKKRMGK